MAWIVKDEDEHAFFIELKQSPDRVVGLLVTTIIEDRLTEAIRARWHDAKDESGDQLLDRLFAYFGPLGNFGTKIEIGFVIGLYTKETMKDLYSVRKIRNAFAHKLAPKDFEAQAIKDLSTNLKIPDKYPISVSPSTGAKLRISPKPLTRSEFARVLLGVSSVDEIKSPRNRFIRAAELLSGLLYAAGADPSLTKISPQF